MSSRLVEDIERVLRDGFSWTGDSISTANLAEEIARVAERRVKKDAALGLHAVADDIERLPTPDWSEIETEQALSIRNAVREMAERWSV